jgi:thiol-disulfide isomerase/thioredoxin
MKQKLGWGGEAKTAAPPPPAWVKPPKNGNGKNSPTAALPGSSGVIAGQVIDSFNQRRPNAIVQASATDAAGDEPIDASTNADGYFVIQGLKTGRRYKLLAWAQKGDQPLGGTTIATAPNVQVVIKVSEQFATPQPPTSKLEPGGRLPGKSPARDNGPTYLNDPDRPAGDRHFDANQDAPRRHAPPLRPENLTLEPRLADNNPPRVELPPAPSTRTPALGGPSTGTSTSCQLDGNRLVDFVLFDVAGKPYRFSERKAKLTLLDFWGTWCPPCIQGMPQLATWQKKYAGQGLEVIGIAYEEGTLKEKSDRVSFVARRQGVNYRLLLGDGEHCPVLTKLNVQQYPTLILVDGQGNVVWRGEGLTLQNKAKLQAELDKRLGAP